MRKLKWGMVGGGPGAGIGPAHRRAAALDGHFELTAGAFSRDQDGRRADPLARSFATARDGVLGMAFIEAAVESHRRSSEWVDINL